MARKPRVLIKGGIYHVTCRGNERREIFADDRDRMRFLDRLAESAEAYQVRVYLYCLMPNHVHLLVETPQGNLSRFMGSLLTGYTVFFNLRHHRSGHLFQGRYGAQMVAGDSYLLALSRYIHLNPVQIEGVREQPLKDRIRQLHEYRWSSLRKYMGTATPSGGLETAPLLAMVKGGRADRPEKAYRRFVESGLAHSDDEFKQLMARKEIAIGSTDFMRSIMELHRQKAQMDLKREDVALRHIRSWKSPAEVLDAVRRVMGPRWAEFESFKTGREVRGFTAWALVQYAGLSQRETASHVRVGTGAGVSRMIRVAMESEEWGRWQAILKSRIKG